MARRSFLPVALFVSLMASVLTLSLDARAQDARYDHPLGVQLMLGFVAEQEIDDVEASVNGRPNVGITVEPQEDLEDNLGIAVFYLFELGSGMGLGPRVAFVSSETEQTNTTVNVFDLTALFRYAFQTPSVIPYLDLGVGASFASSEVNLGAMIDTDGIGFHLLGGAGVMVEVADPLALGGGLYVQWHNFPSLKGEGPTAFGTTELEYQATITRFLFAVAGQF
jgi:hypothetical protein